MAVGELDRLSTALRFSNCAIRLLRVRLGVCDSAPLLRLRSACGRKLLETAAYSKPRSCSSPPIPKIAESGLSRNSAPRPKSIQRKLLWLSIRVPVSPINKVPMRSIAYMGGSASKNAIQAGFQVAIIGFTRPVRSLAWCDPIGLAVCAANRRQHKNQWQNQTNSNHIYLIVQVIRKRGASISASSGSSGSR